MTTKSVSPSFVRTIVPVIVGWLIALGLKAGFQLPSDELTAVITPVAIAAYYAAARLFETYVSPRFGWLLGAPGAPAYPPRAPAELPPPLPADAFAAFAAALAGKVAELRATIAAAEAAAAAARELLTAAVAAPQEPPV